MSTSIVFNSKATESMSTDKPTKVRIDASWKGAEGLRLRPTDRKGGPHMLLPLTTKAKGLVVDLDDVVVEKLHEEGMPADFLQAGERYSVIAGTYGWFVVLTGDEHESSIGLATVNIKK